MKIIDLLNKMTNKEDLPEKIKLQGYDYIFTLREDCTGYKWYGEEKTHKSIGKTICQNLEYVLIHEVEILDDEDEEKGLPEKINDWISTVGRVDDSNIERYVHILFEQQTQLYCKINQLIDYLEKQRKGE